MTQRKYRLMGIMLCLTLLLGCIPLSQAFAADSGTSTDIEINETNFPDPAFLDVVKALPGADDGVFTEDEIAAIWWINGTNKGIEDLTGIEYFTALTRLNLSDNNLTALDISHNTELEVLYCENNKLAALDVSHNTALEELWVFTNRLTELDVTSCPNLRILDCHLNQITELDVSNNPLLTQLDVAVTKLVALDLSNNPSITFLGTSKIKRTVANGTPLSDLPGFDVSKVSGVSGGNFNNDKVNFTGNQITYTYDLSNGSTAQFTLVKGGDVIQDAEYTVEHWFEGPDDSWTLKPEFTLTRVGTVGEKTTAYPLTAWERPGYVWRDLKQLDIAQDGSTVVKIKYYLNRSTISFDPNGGSGSMEDFVILYNNPTALPECTFVRDGYNFIGWGVESNDTVPTFEDKHVMTFTGSDGSSLTLYALWEAHAHTVTPVAGQEPTCTEDGWKAYYTCECGKAFADEECTEEISDVDAWKLNEGKLDKLGHKPGEWNHDEESHWKNCETCGDKVESANHTYGEWVVETEPTATTDGSQKHVCSVCGYEEAQVIPATGEVDPVDPQNPAKPDVPVNPDIPSNPDTPDTPSTPDTPTKPDTATDSSASQNNLPKTNDASHILLWALVSLASLGGAAGALFAYNRKKSFH